jgi:hypothetical protein
MALTDTSFSGVKQVDEIPVPAKGVVCYVVRPLKDVALGAGEGHIVQLE